MKHKRVKQAVLSLCLPAVLGMVLMGCSNPSKAANPVPQIYVAGAYGEGEGAAYTPCYWLNGTRSDLSIGNKETGDAYAIAVSGGSVYAAGRYVPLVKDGPIPCYWLNGTKYDLSTGEGTYGDACAVAVSGGSVYVAGYYYGDAASTPCYWVGAERHDLPIGNAPEGPAWAIAVELR
ncbi:MAG: hypothetical protein LBE02_01865 [Spirochaetaceae bacterium]|jgi:hypothetical protein|nr:hypothetical protein [Spirochaetaceae bacterium]